MASPVAALLICTLASGTAWADSVDQSAPPPHFGAQAAGAVDAEGTLTDAQLAEQVQLLFWRNRRAPTEVPDDTLGATAAGMVLSTVTGGAGSGQDIMRVPDGPSEASVPSANRPEPATIR